MSRVTKKLGMDDIIVNAAESHHYDVPMTHQCHGSLFAADAISASREWARYDTSEMFIEKMSELEKLIKDISGIEKVHIMQAGREIITYVDPEKVSDKDLEKTLKTIWKNRRTARLSWYYWVTAIRENKLVNFYANNFIKNC